MKFVTAMEFLFWAKAYDIEPDLRYQEPRGIVYNPDRSFDRYWEVPESHDDLRPFVRHILSGIDAWEYCLAWPRGGYWPINSKNVSQSPEHLHQLKQIGVPFGTQCALGFGLDEKEKLIDLICTQVQFGWCVDDDLFIIPEHGRQFLQSDHHKVIHMSFRDEKYIPAFVDHMAGKGYLLPDETPDDTFKHPDWMD